MYSITNVYSICLPYRPQVRSAHQSGSSNIGRSRCARSMRHIFVFNWLRLITRAILVIGSDCGKTVVSKRIIHWHIIHIIDLIDRYKYNG
jgi:hypothetical protein